MRKPLPKLRQYSAYRKIMTWLRRSGRADIGFHLSWTKIGHLVAKRRTVAQNLKITRTWNREVNTGVMLWIYFQQSPFQFPRFEHNVHENEQVKCSNPCPYTTLLEPLHVYNNMAANPPLLRTQSAALLSSALTSVPSQSITRDMQLMPTYLSYDK